MQNQTFKKLDSFSHVYVEKRALEYKTTKFILNKLQNSQIIECNHYKDIFNSYSNNFRLQKDYSTKIILAKKEDNFLYEGSSLIQNQDQKNFFYTPVILNCLYDCHYCFLQGMYPSSFIVVFVNIEDFFYHVEEKLESLNNEKIFLSISYDSDLLALENITNITNQWLDFAKNKKNLELEIRTKSANYKSICNNNINKNILLSYSLSPNIICKNYEINCAKLENRVKALNKSLQDGWKISIVIDPIIKIDDYKKVYLEFIEYLKDNIDLKKIEYFIIGCFRMSSNHLKNIKKTNLTSDIIYDNYEIKNQTVYYKDEKEIIAYIKTLLKPYKIYTT
jgi:spore photoproduct lyase